jgi:hypothetical protein
MTTYQVTGNTPYGDYQPGEEFEADLTDEQEDRALERGAIKRVGKPRQKKEEEDDA